MVRRSPTSAIPQRMCVGCRLRAPVHELVRVVASPPGPDGPALPVLVPDLRRRLPGRGAHVHPTAKCLTTALRKRAFQRALGLSVTPDHVALEQLIGPDPGQDHVRTTNPSPSVARKTGRPA